MTTVRQLLAKKGAEVHSIHPDASVLEAIRTLADKNIGALVVIEDGKPVGIFTERHYAREVFLKGKSSPETRVGDVMTTEVICASPKETVEECMALMTDKRVRHLPVLDDEALVGIVSIGDLVKSIIAQQRFHIEQLEHYIRS